MRKNIQLQMRRTCVANKIMLAAANVQQKQTDRQTHSQKELRWEKKGETTHAHELIP